MREVTRWAGQPTGPEENGGLSDPERVWGRKYHQHSANTFEPPRIHLSPFESAIGYSLIPVIGDATCRSEPNSVTLALLQPLRCPSRDTRTSRQRPVR